MLKVLRLALACAGMSVAAGAQGGAQLYEPLADSVRAGLQAAIADRPAPRHGFKNSMEAANWLTEMAQRLERRIPHLGTRLDLLRTVHYEATRSGLDPQLVLALIQVESNFRKFALSSAGARGYTQVMPFWINQIGKKGDNLFNLRTNLRYGCVILRHYLDIEKGDLWRALGRYNGSLGKPEYPEMVLSSLRTRWRYESRQTALAY
ncbi:MAG: lytic transglycosylase domain-containing protein [Betaproteobacteria bacterium]|nr:lytic transglycosylase domain-containing protein [Betaproteobacteria bacterium]